jgi:hypothetical protein
MNVGECRLFRGARSRLSRIIEMRSTALLVGYWITVADGVEGGVPEVKERLSASDRIDAVKDEPGSCRSSAGVVEIQSLLVDGVSSGCWGGSR